MIRKLAEDVVRATHHSPKQEVKEDGLFVWRRRQRKEQPVEATSSKNLGPRSHPKRWRPPPPLPREPSPAPTSPPPPPPPPSQQRSQPLPTHTPRQTSQPPPPPTPPPLHLRAKLSHAHESDVYPSRFQHRVIKEERSPPTVESSTLSLDSIADLESLGQVAILSTAVEEQEEHGNESSIPPIEVHHIPSSSPRSQQVTEVRDGHSEQQAEDISALRTAQTMYQKQVLLVLKQDLYEKQREGKVLHHYYSTSTTGALESRHSIAHDSQRQWVLSTERGLRALVSNKEKADIDKIETITARQDFIRRRLQELKTRLIAARISKLTARISLQRLRVEQKHAEETLRDVRILIREGEDAELKWHYLQLIEQRRHRRELALIHLLPSIDSEVRLIYDELTVVATRKTVDTTMRNIEKQLGVSLSLSNRVLYLRAKAWRLARDWQPDSSEVYTASVLEAWKSEARRLYSFSQSLDLLLRRASQKKFVARASATAEGQRYHRRLVAALVTDEIDIMKCRSSCGLASQSAIWRAE